MWRSMLMAGSLVLAAPAVAQESAIPNDPELSALAETARSDTEAPAVALMRWQGGELRIGVAGVRATGTDITATTGDLWHMGSNTKSMTATLVARLAEQGVIGWDDTIAQHLGGVIEEIRPDYADLTFRHLLSHRSGVPANIGMVDMIRFATEGSGARPMPEQRLDYAGRILRSEPAAQAETGFLYSNAGYVIAGAMLEQVTGEPWEELMQRDVFEPLGMNSAGFGAPGSTDTVDQPRGHASGLFGRLSPRAGALADNPPVLGPAGTVHLSLRDLARYLSVHMAGHRGEETDFLSAESWQILHTPPFGGGYAMGWGVDGGMLMHAGSNTMWLVQMVIESERDLAMAVAVNDGRVNRHQPVQAELAGTLRAME